MSVVGTALNAPESAVVLARQNPLDLQGQATSPPAQQPKPLDRVPLAIRHQEIPEPGFPHPQVSIPFDLPRTTFRSACHSGEADSRTAIAAGVVKEKLSLNKRPHSFRGSAEADLFVPGARRW